VLSVLALSIWVGVSGALFHLDKLQIGRAHNYALEHLVWHVPEFSVLWHPFVERRELDWQDIVVFGYAAAVFAYLGLPFVAKIIQQIGTGLIDVTKSLFVSEGWKL
jgi:hypothetical protein